jgi:hypothetical protein
MLTKRIKSSQEQLEEMLMKEPDGKQFLDELNKFEKELRLQANQKKGGKKK